MRVRAGAIISANCRRSLGGRASGPAALWSFSFDSNLCTPISEMCMFGIDGILLSPRLGRDVVSSSVYADLN